MGNRSSSENAEEGTAGGSPPTEEISEEQQMSYWQMMKQGYQELVNAIIRPPRCQYEIYHLGPTTFEFCSKKFQRVDFELRNKRNLKVVCSMWEPVEKPNEILPCVIYMHGNSSARVEALPQLSLVLSLGATMVAFDFAGSGQSEGEYVSLGYFEKDDLDCVIEYLRNCGKISTIALWGRSMGAATSLLHGERDPSIAGMVLDSSFASLHMLAEEMVEKGKEHGVNVPGFIVRMAIRWIRSSVLKSALFDINLLSPIEHADKCYIPALFVAAQGDEFVPPHHSQQIFDRYAGDKNIIIVDGDHNTMRPQFLFDSAGIFLASTLQIPEHWMLEGAQSMRAGRLPWSSNPRVSAERYPADISYDDLFTILDNDGNLMLGDGGVTGLDFENDLGMTAARQAEVRAAIFAMLGDNSMRPLPPAPAPRGGGSAGGEEGIFPNASSPSLGSGPMAPLPSQNGSTEEWSCTACTLLNPSTRLDCSACGTYHMSE